MNAVPKISIIIPIYKAEAYLNRCLDSVLNQTFTDFEIICLNDGSPDNCNKILAEYAKKDGRIKVINKENTGVSDTRNVGLSVAKGSYILFMDSDDCIHPQTLEITYFLAKKNNADMVYYRHIAQDYTEIGPYLNQSFDKNVVKYKVVDNVLKYATEKNHGGTSWKIRHGFIWAYLFKKSFIQDIKFSIHIKIGEDLVWLLKVLHKKPVTVLTKLPLYFYIPNSNSALSRVNKIDYIQNMTDGLLETWRVFNNANIYDKKLYMHEFAWPVMIPVVRNAKQLQNNVEKNIAKKCILKLYRAGLVVYPCSFKAIKCYFRIKKLLRNN